MKTIQTAPTSRKRNWSRFAIALGTAATLSLGACGGGDEEGGGGDGGDGDGGGGGGDVVVPETAEGTMKAYAKAVGEKDLGTAFGLLPESYQGDLNGIVSEFGNAMDPTLWDSALSIGKDLGFLLTEKGDIVKASNLFKQADTASNGELSKNFDPIAKAINDLFTSEEITLDAMKKGNVYDLLSGPAAGLVDNMAAFPEVGEADEDLKAFSESTVKTLSEDGDSAVLEVTIDGQTKNMPFTKVDGRWIPEEVAGDWDNMIKEAKGSVAEMKASVEKNKGQASAMIGMVSGIIGGLKNAKSGEELDAALMGLGALMGGGAGGAEGGGGF